MRIAPSNRRRPGLKTPNTEAKVAFQISDRPLAENSKKVSKSGAFIRRGDEGIHRKEGVKDA